MRSGPPSGRVRRPRAGSPSPSGPPPTYRTRLLARATWEDFEALFARHGGVQNGCWCMFYHRERPLRGLPDDLRIAQNRRDHAELVQRGAPDGVLVYDRAEPVGWCQFARREELPRIDRGRIYRSLELPPPASPSWRITCFFVENDRRRRGVATLALRAALEAIRERGGGVVEAFPVTHGRAVPVWFGTVAMFEREGFVRVASLGASQLVMRATLAPPPDDEGRAPRSSASGRDG